MNCMLLDQAIASAQSAFFHQDKGAFTVTVRSAQPAIPDNPRTARLLDTALEGFPSSKTHRILEILERVLERHGSKM